MTRPVASLPDALRQEIVDHCLSELPNEGCGLLAVSAGRVVRVYPTSNSDSSPTSFTIPPEEHFAALIDAEANGWEIGAVFHSHPNGPPTMSTTDHARALEPEWTYFVVGLGHGEPAVAAHTI